MPQTAKRGSIDLRSPAPPQPSDPEAPQPIAADSALARSPGARRSLLVVGLLFAAFLAGTLGYVHWMSQMAMNASAIEAARRHSDTIAAFRTTYTAQVVKKARAHGLAVSHDAASSVVSSAYTVSPTWVVSPVR